jgi:hypothetical protein
MNYYHESQQLYRKQAQLKCIHRCAIKLNPDKESPYGDINYLVKWCTENIGPRWIDWYYRGAGVWCFAHETDMVLFWMTHG